MPAILLMIALLAAGHIGTNAASQRDLDVAFVVDDSSTICGGAKPCENWYSVLHFIEKIIDSLLIGSDKTRVAFIKFSNEPHVEWYFNRYSDKNALLSAIESVAYEGGELQTQGALKNTIATVFSAAAEERPTIPKLGILITDGAPNIDPKAAGAQGKALQDAGITVFVVCVTPGCPKELAAGIASPPKQDGETYFLVNGFSSFETVEKEIVKKIHAV